MVEVQVPLEIPDAHTCDKYIWVESIEEMKVWCKDNCDKPWSITLSGSLDGPSFTFQSEEDATYFKLSWM